MNNTEKAFNILCDKEVILGFEKAGYYFIELPIASTPYSTEEMLVDATSDVIYIVGHSSNFFIEGKKSSQHNLYAFMLANNMNMDLTERKYIGRWSLDYKADSLNDAINTKGTGYFTYVVGIPTSVSPEAMAEIMQLAIESYCNSRSKMNYFCHLVNSGQEIPFEFINFETDSLDDTINISLHPAFEKLLEDNDFIITEEDIADKLLEDEE